jgi:hypothetical protein
MRAVSAIVILLGLAAPSRAVGQRIQGRVIDSSTRQPIPVVLLRLMKGDIETTSAMSDSAGRFRLTAPAPGQYHLLGSRIGYADAETQSIELHADSTLVAELVMSVDAVKFAPLTVVAPRDRYLEARGFYERQESGTGDFLSGDQLRRRNARSLVDLLRGMRGVKIQRVNWKSEVYLAGANCLPQIVVDGVTMRYGGKTVAATGAQTIEDLVNVDHIQGVEVYRGGSGAPIEFEGPNAGCGVIVIWTRVR